MYWKSSKHEDGKWIGPARVLMVEHNAVWLSHLTRLYRIAPEHVCMLSSNEQLIARSLQELGAAPIQGSGVFQYQDCLENHPEGESHHPSPPRGEAIIPEVVLPTNTQNEVPTENRPASPGTGQPNAESEINSSRPPSPHDPDSPNPDASMTPVPEDDEDEDSLWTDAFSHDHWGVEGDKLIRYHNVPRLRTFQPQEDPSCPVPICHLGTVRKTTGKYRSGERFCIQEPWQDTVTSHRCLADAWTGKTVFTIDQDKLEETHVLESDPKPENEKSTGIIRSYVKCF